MLVMRGGLSIGLSVCTASALLAACQPLEPVRPASNVSVAVDEEADWQKVATAEDEDRIRRLDAAWAEAVQDARKAGFASQLRAEGALLDASARLPRAAPPPGSYKCRLVKLGGAARAKAFIAYKPFFCFVGINGEQLSITKQTGSRRPGGYLFDTEKTGRLIFLGSEALGTEENPGAYGEDPARSMAGVFERYGDFRYRLVVPWPRGESKLDVFELIPLPPPAE
jgi:hypothetical protein